MKPTLTVLAILFFCANALQAQLAEVGIDVRVNERYAQTPLYSSVVHEVSLSNPGSSDIVVDLRLDESRSQVPDNWTIAFEPQVVVAGNSSMVIEIHTTPYSIGQADIKLDAFVAGSNIASSSRLSIITHELDYVLYKTLHHDDAVNQYEKAMVYIGEELDDRVGKYATLDWSNKKAVQRLADEFDISIIPIGGQSGSVIGHSSADDASSSISLLNRLIEQGRKILITSENGASMAFSADGSQDAQMFFTDVLGVKGVGAPTPRYVEDEGQPLQPSEFQLVGVSHDPVSRDLEQIAVNAKSDNGTIPFVRETDVLEIIEGSSAFPIFFYGGDNTAIGGTRVEIGEARVVYLGFGLEGIVDDRERALVLKGILDWLQYGSLVTSAGNDDEIPGGAVVNLNPNPAGSAAQLSYSAVNPVTQAKVYIVDLQGRIVQNIHNGPLSVGDHVFRLNTANLAAGSYQVIIETPGKVLQRTLQTVR